MVSLLFLYGMNCCSLDKAEITSPRALKLLLMDWASYETHKTSDINEKSYGAGGGRVELVLRNKSSASLHQTISKLLI